MKNKFDKELLSKLKSILLKKSEGYFYDEEIREYQHKTETPNKNEQLNFSSLNVKDIKDETKRKEKDEDLILIKKKVTTHYVPPDLLAVKMFIEIFGQEVNSNDLSKLTDNELDILKKDIIKKLEEN